MCVVWQKGAEGRVGGDRECGGSRGPEIYFQVIVVPFMLVFIAELTQSTAMRVFGVIELANNGAFVSSRCINRPQGENILHGCIALERRADLRGFNENPSPYLLTQRY